MNEKFMKENIIYTYRYMWLIKGEENLNINYVSGLREEHESYVLFMLDKLNIEKFTRVYIHEVDPEQVEFYETLVKDGLSYQVQGGVGVDIIPCLGGEENEN